MNELKRVIVYLIRNFKNYFKILINNRVNNYYIPNLYIKNVIMIDPSKVKYFNQTKIMFSWENVNS